MKREITVVGDIAIIQLTQGKSAVIDAEDVHLVSGFDWTVMNSARTSYAKRNDWCGGKQKSVLLHRVVFGAADGVRVDHRDGDGLNCRKSNLRQATYKQNNLNTRGHIDSKTGLKGVSKHSLCNKYRAEIQIGGKKKYLGMFETAAKAKAAYDLANAQIHGEFGRTK